jgi:hypothetical protein
LRLLFALVFTLFGISAFAEDRLAREDEPALLVVQRVVASQWQHEPAGYYFRKAVDGNPLTSWGTGGKFQGSEWIQLYFDHPVILTQLELAIGLQGDPGNFKSNGRVKTAELTFSDGTKQTVGFEDKMGFQRRTLFPVRTRWVRISVTEIYPGAQGDFTRDFGVAEIRCYGADSLPRVSLVPGTKPVL